jgi:thioredoxin 1
MNRRTLTALLGACTVLAMTSLPLSAEEVHWARPPFANILKTAQQQNKHIFIDFYTTWCGPCKQLDKVTYRDEKVVDYLNSIVAVKCDAEKGEGETLANEFRVKAYPTLMLLGPDGKEIDRHVGFLGPEDFIEVIRGYQNGIGTVAYYEALLEREPENADALLTLGMKYAAAVKSEQAQATLEKLLEIDPDTEHKAEIYYQLGYALAADDRNRDAIEYYDKVLDEFPDSDYRDEALQMQARAYFKIGEKAKSLEAYRRYLGRHPDDPSAMNGFAWFCAQRKFGFDQALPVALKAVEVSNRDPGILDTLAELYYAMGDYNNAIKIGEEAAAKEPDDQYLKDQVNKFRKAANERASR